MGWCNRSIGTWAIKLHPASRKRGGLQYKRSRWQPDIKRSHERISFLSTCDHATPFDEIPAAAQKTLLCDLDISSVDFHPAALSRPTEPERRDMADTSQLKVPRTDS